MILYLVYWGILLIIFSFIIYKPLNKSRIRKGKKTLNFWVFTYGTLILLLIVEIIYKVIQLS